MDYLRGGITPILQKDNADPWGMSDFQLERIGTDGEPFTLQEKPDGVFRYMQSVQVIEDGPVYRAIEAFFAKDNNRIRMEYRIYKHSPAVDIHADVFFNDADRFVKLQIPLAVKGDYVGGTAFCTEPLFMDGRECTAQRFVAVKDGKQGLAILNNCQYGSSFEDDTIYLSLLRGAAYCAHPINDRPLIPTDRFIKRIDQGWLTYDFRLIPAAENEWHRLAEAFNQPPYALNIFPDGSAAPTPCAVCISNPDVTLEALKKAETADGFVVRLYNGSEDEADATFTCGGATADLHFGKFEVKTLLLTGDTLTEQAQMII